LGSERTFRYIVRDFESVCCVLEGYERYELHEFAKLCYIVDRVLSGLDVLSNFLCKFGREEGETSSAFKEELDRG
jgi:hypothetical protein